MNKIIHISFIMVLMGIVLSVPISRHYCGGTLTQTSISEHEEHSCCEQESMPKDHCHTEVHYFTDDHDLNISFSNFELGNISDFWIENLLFDTDLRWDTYQFTKGYINPSDTPPKNETGLYKYVQSFLM